MSSGRADPHCRRVFVRSAKITVIGNLILLDILRDSSEGNRAGAVFAAGEAVRAGGHPVRDCRCRRASPA